MNHLQETAVNHVKSAGLLGDGFGSTPEMCKKNLIWVVTKMQQGHFEDPTLKFQIPLQIAAEREIARSLIGDPNFSWAVSLKEFAEDFLCCGCVPSFLSFPIQYAFISKSSSSTTVGFSIL
ncbi:hypothetical protein LOK49_LG11G00024, partial [Camellia lanceoleosa]